MIRRSAETILVSEEQLAEAIRLVEQTCAGAGIEPDIEVAPYIDPEDEDDNWLTLITVGVRTPVPTPRLIDLITGIGRALRSRGLLEPQLPLGFLVSPEL